jgi:hypothetical protein
MPTVIIHCWMMLSWPRRPLGRELRDIGGRDRGVRADREPDQSPGRDQHEPVHGERRQDRADGVDGGVGDEQGLTPEVVGQGSG